MSDGTIVVQSDLQRSQPGLIADGLSNDLIDGNTGVDIRTAGFLRVRAGQKCRPRPCVVTRAVSERIGVVVIES